ncbi:MAG: glycosyltransferase family 4 protein [Elainellaceae cyanobacterium]
MSQLSVNLSFLIPQPTGLMTYATQLIPHLQCLSPTLITANPTPDFECYPVSPKMTAAYGTRGHLRRLLWTQLRLPRICQALKTQLLFSPIPEAPLYASCRSLVTVHDLIPIRFPKRFSPLTLYQRVYMPQVLHQAQHILANSDQTARDVVEFFSIPAHKITSVPLAYDEAHFRPLDLPIKPYFLYIGRSDPHKNLRRLIEAFAQISASSKYELWLVGSLDPRYTPVLQSLAHQLGITDQIKFLDYVPYADLPILLNQAIALVFPSLWEGFGLPVLEAMGCGTPVITSNCSSLPEVAGDAAMLVNPYNVAELADAMSQVAADSQVRSQLRRAGLARARQFSWQKTGLETAQVLRQYL